MASRPRRRLRCLASALLPPHPARAGALAHGPDDRPKGGWCQPGDLPAGSPAPFLPAPLLPGGEVVPLYRPVARRWEDSSDASFDSDGQRIDRSGGIPFLNVERLHEPEVYNMGNYSEGDKVQAITNIHNPSFDFYSAGGTGACVILVPGGGHRMLGVGGCSDLVTLFASRGISTAILRCRLRSDGYDMAVDGLHDTLQAILLVRANASRWGLDPARIGCVGMSAGAEHAAGAATEFVEFADNTVHRRHVSARPDFVGVLFTGPTLFEADPALDKEGGGRYAGMSEQGAEGQANNDAQTVAERAGRSGPPTIPPDCPPSFVASAGPGDKIHAAWSVSYFSAMLYAGVPNAEIHLYARGRHGQLPRGVDGVGPWTDRLLEWLSVLGFLGAAGEETVAARNVAARVGGGHVPQ